MNITLQTFCLLQTLCSYFSKQTTQCIQKSWRSKHSFCGTVNKIHRAQEVLKVYILQNLHLYIAYIYSWQPEKNNHFLPNACTPSLSKIFKVHHGHELRISLFHKCSTLSDPLASHGHSHPGGQQSDRLTASCCSCKTHSQRFACILPDI